VININKHDIVSLKTCVVDLDFPSHQGSSAVARLTIPASLKTKLSSTWQWKTLGSWRQLYGYLNGGIEAPADGDVPPAFPRRVKLILRRTFDHSIVTDLWTTRPVLRGVHWDCLVPLGYYVRRRDFLHARLSHVWHRLALYHYRIQDGPITPKCHFLVKNRY